jgi:flagellar biogenesis protein FliO
MESNALLNIVIALLIVVALMAIFFVLLRKYSADISYSNQGKIKIIAQQRAALKTQLLLIEADNRVSLLAISGDNVVPVWTKSDRKEEKADVP